MTNAIPVRNAQELGHVIQTARRLQRLRQDEIGRLSHSFIGELEVGKPTAQIGKVLEAMRELGLKVYVELPAGIDARAFESFGTQRR